MASSVIVTGSAPLMLMISLVTSVITWQHVIGHTYTSAQSMHMAPIILLTSISTCTGSVLFFMSMATVAIWRCLLTPFRKFSPPNISQCTEELAPEIRPDIDAKSFAARATSQVKHESMGDGSVARRVFRGDILTITMIWTNIYGLGIASFFMSYVATMASSLCTFSCVVAMSVVSLYEAYMERADPIKRQWHVGRGTGKVRAALHTTVMVISIASVCTIGAHVAGIHVNSIGYIQPEDVFLGIIGPVVTPFLLKGVRRPHITTLATLETSLPFTVFICVTFMSTALALGMRPYESSNELGRNIAAATTLLPLSWGLVTICVLHCVFRRRMLYVFSTFMTVFAGRELTISKNSNVVIATFILQFVAFMLTIAASIPYSVGVIADVLGWEPIQDSVSIQLDREEKKEHGDL